MQYAALVCLSLAAVAQGARLRHSQHGQMNPGAVAHILVQVEDKWLQQAMAFAACNTSDASGSACTEGAMGEFVASCKTVVGAMVEGSSGDKSVINEYLGDVCGQGELQGWKQQLCGNLTQALSNAMSEDSYTNREDMNFEKICSSFMTQGFLKRAVEEEKAREEAERVRAAKEAEEARKRAEEEAKAEEAKKKAEEAQAKAEAAKKAADEAAKKREEAKAEAAEAKRKQDEAAEAEEKKKQAEAAANATVTEAGSNASTVAAQINASTPAANTTDSKPAPAPKNASQETSAPNVQLQNEAGYSAPAANTSQPAEAVKQVKLVAVSQKSVSNASSTSAQNTSQPMAKPAKLMTLVQQKKVMKRK